MSYKKINHKALKRQEEYIFLGAMLAPTTAGRNERNIGVIPTVAANHKRDHKMSNGGRKQKKRITLVINYKADGEKRVRKNCQNLGYVKKKHFGRHSVNPKQPGFGLAPSPNILTTSDDSYHYFYEEQKRITHK
jgi:hypothetical protein